MALQGNIDSFPLVDVLGLLAGSQKSGRLVVNADRCNALIWLDEGRIVGASSAPPSSTLMDVEPAEALFDLLRAQQGAFAFENDQVCPNPCEPVEARTAIDTALEALAEWNAITAVIPSLTAPLALRPTIEGEVTIDDRLWGGMVALMGVAVRDGGVVNACAFVEYLGLGEFDALRLGFDLIELGLIELAPLPEPTEPQATAPAPSSNAPTPGGDLPPMGLPSVTLPPPGSTAPMHPSLAAPPPVGVSSPGLGGPPPFPDTTPAPPSTGPLPPPHRNIAPMVDDSEAELARQLAMLSPRAAEAVAGADATSNGSDPDGPRVARFFDTA